MPRLDYYKLAPGPFDQLTAVSHSLVSSSLDPQLRLLVEIRVSQINGCVYCVDLHSRQARQAGVTQQRLDSLPVWHESPFFAPHEHAALAWAESLTHVAQTHAPDDAFAPLSAHFSATQIVDLSLTIAVMNAWNRIAVGFRKTP